MINSRRVGKPANSGASSAAVLGLGNAWRNELGDTLADLLRQEHTSLHAHAFWGRLLLAPFLFIKRKGPQCFRMWA